MVLDLRGLDFMDSSGLRLVVSPTCGRARPAAGSRSSAATETVHRVFEITRMSDRLDFVADPAELG